MKIVYSSRYDRNYKLIASCIRVYYWATNEYSPSDSVRFFGDWEAMQ